MQRRTIDLWVSLDSEKQAKDVVNKLEGLQGMPNYFLAVTLCFRDEKTSCDLPMQD